MNKNIEKALEKIAMEESYAIEVRGGLDSRNNDDEDFKEIQCFGNPENAGKSLRTGQKQ